MPPGAVMEIARRVSRPVDSVAERLRSAGYAVAYSASLTDEDRLLLSKSLDGKPPWLSDPEPIPVWHLARAEPIPSGTWPVPRSSLTRTRTS